MKMKQHMIMTVTKVRAIKTVMRIITIMIAWNYYVINIIWKKRGNYHTYAV